MDDALAPERMRLVREHLTLSTDMIVSSAPPERAGAGAAMLVAAMLAWR